MTGRPSAACERGLTLLRAGMPLAQAAAAAGIARSTLQRAARAAGLPAGKPGRPAQEPR